MEQVYLHFLHDEHYLPELLCEVDRLPRRHLVVVHPLSVAPR